VIVATARRGRRSWSRRGVVGSRWPLARHRRQFWMCAENGDRGDCQDDPPTAGRRALGIATIWATPRLRRYRDTCEGGDAIETSVFSDCGYTKGRRHLRSRPTWDTGDCGHGGDHGGLRDGRDRWKRAETADPAEGRNSGKTFVPWGQRGSGPTGGLVAAPTTPGRAAAAARARMAATPRTAITPCSTATPPTAAMATPQMVTAAATVAPVPAPDHPSTEEHGRIHHCPPLPLELETPSFFLSSNVLR